MAAAVLGWNIVCFTGGRARLVLLLGTAAVTATLLLTPNPVGDKFRGMLTGHDVHSDYPDDRIVFWKVNFEMVKERQFIGHGENLGTAYRAPYYERLGFSAFERKYEAHDSTSSWPSTVGVGLALVMLWFGWQAAAAWHLRICGLGGAAALQTVVANSALAR